MTLFDEFPESMRIWLQDRYPGQRFYIPKSSDRDRDLRNREIRSAFDRDRLAGMSIRGAIRDLAASYHLSGRMVRLIVFPSVPSGEMFADDFNTTGD